MYGASYRNHVARGWNILAANGIAKPKSEVDIMEIVRREFLKTTGKAMTMGAAAFALGGRVMGASDRVRVAVCGVRGRGNDHIKGFAKVPGVELAALCDVDENVLKM